MGDPVITIKLGIRRGLAAMLVGAALVATPLAASTAVAAPTVGTESHSTSTWDAELVMLTYGFAEADTFKGTTLQLPRFEAVAGGVRRELTGVSFDYEYLGDSGRELANWSTQDSVVDAYESTFHLTLSFAGEVVEAQYQWFKKAGPLTVRAGSTYDLGSLGPRESGTHTPRDLSAYVGTGSFPVDVAASTTETVGTDGRGAYAQGWESGGVTVTVTYTFQNVTEVTPEAPSLSTPGCGEAASVVLPATDGVEYTKVSDGDVVSVTAAAKEGYVMAEGATANWSLTIPKVVACDLPVTPEAPSLSTPGCGEAASVVLPATDGVEYTKVSDGDVVSVTAAAKEGYVMAEGATANWSLTIPEVVACGVVDSEEDTDPADTELAWTGVEVAGSLSSALGLLGAGVALIAATRRRA